MKLVPADEHSREALKSSSLERTLDTCLAMYGRDLPTPVAQHLFHQSREWAFDRAWLEFKVAVELQGGIWTGGAHVRGLGYINDVDKLNSAQVLGWVVLWFTTNHLEDHPEESIELIRQAINRRRGENKC